MKTAIISRVQNLTIAPKKYLYQFGHAIWWGKEPKIIKTFLESYDLEGKKIVPFCTSGGSGISGSISGIKKSAKGATVVEGKNLTDSSAGSVKNWAKSGGGQMLIGVGGRGYYQEEGKEAVEILPGTVINIPANVKHWHGAAPDSWFSHLALEVPGAETANEWCEPVSEEEYGKLK